jgi:hypothetical protein
MDSDPIRRMVVGDAIEEDTAGAISEDHRVVRLVAERVSLVLVLLRTADTVPALDQACQALAHRRPARRSTAQETGMAAASFAKTVDRAPGSTREVANNDD